MNPKAVIAALLLAFAAAAQAMPPAKPAGGPAVKGEVLETKDVEIYTYLRLKMKDGEIWAAVPKAAVKKGATVEIENAMMMENFESKSLGRKFDRLVFGQLAGAAGAAPAAVPMGKPHGNIPQASPEAVKVAKASGPDARTVAEVVGGRAKLKDKTVLIHAKVVKVNEGIMGKNWLHVQDGSGKAADGSNDIIVTTTDTANIGDVVNVKGVVKTDVDLGSGYAYAVLVQDAKVTK